MIKADQLREFRPTYRFQDGSEITLATIQGILTEAAESMEIPVSFERDEVKSGGLFNSQVDDCLVLYHPDHPNDYYRFCITVRKQGTMAFIAVNDFGNSKQLKKINTQEFMKQDRKGKQMSYKVGSMIGQSLRTLGMDKNAIAYEQNYYSALVSIFDELIS